MKQIDEIRETAGIAKSFLSNNRSPCAILIALDDIPRLCDALELVMEIARDECESPYFDEVAKILEGK